MLSFIVYAQIAIVTIIYCITALPFLALSIPFCGFKRSGVEATVRFFIIWYGRAIIHIALKPYIKIIYEDLATDEMTPAIYVCNHRSASDPFLAAIFRMERPLAQAVNGWPMRLPFFGFFARSGGYIDVTSHSYDETLEAVSRLLKNRSSVVVFPEGTRSGNREMNQFHGIFFRIALQLKCPLIPVAIAGNENIPDKLYRVKPGKIMIRKMPVFDTSDYSPSDSYKLKNHVRQLILDETRKMDALLDHA